MLIKNVFTARRIHQILNDFSHFKIITFTQNMNAVAKKHKMAKSVEIGWIEQEVKLVSCKELRSRLSRFASFARTAKIH